uniref:Uncharacterized protein n=1 Tax=viral metagenome TaxID=1070528 RepID=A0A6M3XGG2_9ZZZZ
MRIPIIGSIILLKNILKLVLAYRVAREKTSPGGKDVTPYERKIIRDNAENTLESIIALIRE